MITQRYIIKCVLVLLLITIRAEASGQPSKIAALRDSLRAAKDSNEYTIELNNIAFYYHRLDMDSCLWYAITALDIATRRQHQEGMSYAYTNLALYHLGKSNAKLSIIYNFEALKIDNALNDSGGISIDMGNLANAYRVDQNLEMAIYYEQRSMEISSRFPESGDFDIDLTNYLFHYWKDADKKDSVKWALAQLNAITAKEPYTEEWYLARMYEILLAGNKKTVVQTGRQLDELATITLQKGLPVVALRAYYRILYDMIPNGYPGDTIVYAEKIFSLGKKIKDNITMGEVVDMLYNYYLAAGNKPVAGIYGKTIRDLAAAQFRDVDKLPSVDYLSYFLREQQKKELIYSEQLEQQELVQNELWQKKRRLLLLFLEGILAILALLTGIFCWSWFASRRHMQQLALLNADITDRNTRLKTNDEFKNKLLSVIAHDFRAPLKDIITTAADWKAHVPGRDSMMHSISRVELASRRTLEIFDGILRWIKSQFTDFVYIPVPCDNREMLRRLIADIRQETADKQLQVTFDIPLDATVAADNEMLLFVNRTILQHIISLTEKGGMILIKGRQPDGRIQLTVEGQPVAVTSSLLHLLDQPEQDDKLILITCKDFVDKMGGQIWVRADKPDTFAFIYRLPLYG